MKIETEDLSARMKRGDVLRNFTFWVDGVKYTDLNQVPRNNRKEVEKILAQKSMAALGEILNPHTKELQDTPVVKGINYASNIYYSTLGIIVSLITNSLLEQMFKEYQLNFSILSLSIYGMISGYLAGLIAQYYVGLKSESDYGIDKVELFKIFRKNHNLATTTIVISFLMTLAVFFIINLISQ